MERLLQLIGTPREHGRVPAVAVLPLRLFLGATFIYAGMQKLTDPQFFSPTAPGFIGRQMSGFVRGGSPLAPILTNVAIPHAAQFGALIAFCEVWAGLSAILGLLTRLGALGGLGISLTLYLTATWSVRPYFLGADLPYAMGWLTLLLAGPALYSLDEYFGSQLMRRIAAARAVPMGRGRLAPTPPPLAADPLARSIFVQWLSTAGLVVVGGGIAGSIAKLLTPNRVDVTTATALGGGASSTAPAAASSTPAAGGAATAPTAAPPAAPTTASVPAAPAGYTFLGNAKQLPPNSAGQYTDPISGDPALLIHLPGGQFAAYDAVCTHAGCTVQYDPTQREIVCPCHGAVFDPAHGAQVLAGPAPQPLATLQVIVDPNGNAYGKK